MGIYRARELLLVPSLLSMTRVPLGVAFALTVDRPVVASAVIVLSGASDVLDGWWARRHGQVTAIGSVVDPITDKFFMLCVVLALVSRGELRWLDLLMLGAREVGEAPLVVWLATSHRARRARTRAPMANVPGKLATALQFVAIAAALYHLAFVRTLLVVVAIAGALAAISYWARALGDLRRDAAEDAG